MKISKKFNTILFNTQKYLHYTKDFLLDFTCFDVYKIQLSFFDEFMLFKNKNMINNDFSFFDVMDLFYASNNKENNNDNINANSSSQNIVNINFDNFYEFYERFANDSLFQAERVADPLPFVAPDPDDEFQILETTIQKSQWFTFQPQLPTEFLTNVNYGQRLDKNSRTRIIELRGFGNGFSNTLYFRCRNGEWKLTKFEDLSN